MENQELIGKLTDEIDLAGNGFDVTKDMVMSVDGYEISFRALMEEVQDFRECLEKAFEGEGVPEKADKLFDDLQLYLACTFVTIQKKAWQKGHPRHGQKCILYSANYGRSVESVYLDCPGCVACRFTVPGFYVLANDTFGNGMYVRFADEDDADRWMPYDEPNSDEEE